jgi:hypothetical protein
VFNIKAGISGAATGSFLILKNGNLLAFLVLQGLHANVLFS